MRRVLCRGPGIPYHGRSLSQGPAVEMNSRCLRSGGEEGVPAAEGAVPEERRESGGELGRDPTSQGLEGLMIRTLDFTHNLSMTLMGFQR